MRQAIISSLAKLLSGSIGTVKIFYNHETQEENGLITIFMIRINNPCQGL